MGPLGLVVRVREGPVGLWVEDRVPVEAVGLMERRLGERVAVLERLAVRVCDMLCEVLSEYVSVPEGVPDMRKVRDGDAEGVGVRAATVHERVNDGEGERSRVCDAEPLGERDAVAVERVALGLHEAERVGVVVRGGVWE